MKFWNVVIFLFFILPLTAGKVFSAESIPQRIVSINVCAEELLLLIADPSQIVAVTGFEKSPEASRILKTSPRIKKIRATVEEILAQKPDLVLTGAFTNREAVRFLKILGIRVMVVKVPHNFEDVYRNIEEISKTVGHEDRGRLLIEGMKQALTRVRPEMPKQESAMFFQSEGYTPGAGTFEDSIMQAAGLQNLASRLGIRDYGRLSLEEIVRQKPDIFIFSSDQKENSSIRGSVLNHPAVKKLVPDAKRVVIPACLLNCGAPVSAEAVKILNERLVSR